MIFHSAKQIHILIEVPKSIQSLTDMTYEHVLLHFYFPQISKNWSVIRVSQFVNVTKMIFWGFFPPSSSFLSTSFSLQAVRPF